MLAIRSASYLNSIIVLNYVIRLKRRSVGSAPYSYISSYTHTRKRTLSVIEHQHARVAGVRARDPTHCNDCISCIYLFHTRLHRHQRLLQMLHLQLDLPLRLKLRRRRNGLGERRRLPLRNGGGPRRRINAGERGNAIPQVEQQ